MRSVILNLKGITGVIGGEVRNEDQRFAGSLLLIVECDVPGRDLGHGISS